MRVMMICLAAAALGGIASAKAPAPPAQGPCGGEVERFCERRDPAQIAECLKKNEKRISVACRAEMKRPLAGKGAAGKASKPQGACAEFVERLCKDKGPDQIAGCLEKNEGRLSPACREEMNKPPADKGAAKGDGACGQFVRKFCKDGEPSQIGECLGRNRKKVSAACRAEMDKRPK